jgi:hypothetical protein
MKVETGDKSAAHIGSKVLGAKRVWQASLTT